MIFNQIRNKVKAKLQEIDSINFVADYAISGVSSYPAVMFEPWASNNVEFSQAETKREFKFKLYIFQEYERITKKKAWEILLDVYDDIVDKFKNNLLDGICQKAEIISGEFGTTDNTENGKSVYGIAYLSITILE